MLNNSMFAISKYKLAILAGRFTRNVYILEFERESKKAGSLAREVMRLYEVRGFHLPFETVFPATYVIDKNH